MGKLFLRTAGECWFGKRPFRVRAILGGSWPYSRPPSYSQICPYYEPTTMLKAILVQFCGAAGLPRVLVIILSSCPHFRSGLRLRANRKLGKTRYPFLMNRHSYCWGPSYVSSESCILSEVRPSISRMHPWSLFLKVLAK